MQPLTIRQEPTEYSRTSRFVELKDYNIDGKGNDFLEVTQWENGEGFDLHLSRGEQWLSLTWEEYNAMLAALGDWIEQPADVCPHITSTTDGSNYCKLGLKTLLNYAGESLK
jgi:hypothetical protein